MTAECLVGCNIVWQSGYVAKKGVTVVADCLGDGREASCRGDVFVPDELVLFDLEQLPLTLHMKGLEGSDIVIVYFRFHFTFALVSVCSMLC